MWIITKYYDLDWVLCWWKWPQPVMWAGRVCCRWYFACFVWMRELSACYWIYLARNWPTAMKARKKFSFAKWLRLLWPAIFVNFLDVHCFFVSNFLPSHPCELHFPFVVSLFFCLSLGYLSFIIKTFVWQLFVLGVEQWWLSHTDSETLSLYKPPA